MAAVAVERRVETRRRRGMCIVAVWVVGLVRLVLRLLLVWEVGRVEHGILWQLDLFAYSDAGR